MIAYVLAVLCESDHRMFGPEHKRDFARYFLMVFFLLVLLLMVFFLMVLFLMTTPPNQSLLIDSPASLDCGFWSR